MGDLRIKSIDLVDVGPFFKLTIEFPEHAGLNLICGPNGIGKTSILEAILTSFTIGQRHRLKRRQPASEGNVSTSISSDGSNQTIQTRIASFNPNEGDFANNRSTLSTLIVNIRANRDFEYRPQHNISRDPDFKSADFSHTVSQGLKPDDIKAWFTNRYLLQPHSDKSSWTTEMKENLELATSCFSILDETVRLSEVDVKTFDIIVSTPSGLIPFEFLSSGFKSAYTLLLGIIREIETRDLKISAKNFNGVILIDEIDLHLHPAWQREIGRVLKNSFPSAQIIATTHSPHVIQAAEATEVIQLVRDESGKVAVRAMPNTKYGYAGWTVEEILEEIMGLSDTKTSIFRKAVKNFDEAVDAEDGHAISMAIAELHAMLHPNNPMRKLIELQAAPFLGESALGGSGK